jgi:hypothetical protein
MSGLKEHTEQFTGEEIRLALLIPKITPVLIWERVADFAAWSRRGVWRQRDLEPSSSQAID